jgi:LAO/AO transport system kinase
VLDALGCDIVLIETVGVGQDEVEIAQLAHTTVLVTVPGLGDDVQAIKAGVLEIADVFVVNKADREGADRTIRDLRMMLDLRRTHDMSVWEPPIVSCVATRGDGTDTLIAAIDQHSAQLDHSGQRVRREASRARTELVSRLQARLVARALQALESSEGSIDRLAEGIARREIDPYALADRALSSILRES